MSKTIFVTGIGTEVGKTIASAIVTEALEADYWKPIQAGELENSDSQRVERLISNRKTTFHKNAYTLKTPMSPHAAAKIDGVSIKMNQLKPPKTDSTLVIEGAGGLLVPLNAKNTIADLIAPEFSVILLSRPYLGSINHTLLSIENLKNRGISKISLLFSGEEIKSTEKIIQKMSGVPVIGRIEEEPYFDERVILEYAEKFRKKLCKI